MVGWKQASVNEILANGWHAWERDNYSGTRRIREGGPAFEALVGFIPQRFIDFVRFERRATQLGLDSSLRMRAAEKSEQLVDTPLGPHALEEQFDLDAREILNIIATNHRLGVAVRGGVAERHLEDFLWGSDEVQSLDNLDEDGRSDFSVLLTDGRSVLVECKNASPHTYANGDFKVEVQKTRSQKSDPAGRFYTPDQFDVVASCIWSATRKWDFRFKRMALMDRHATYRDRLAAVHHVDNGWPKSLREALEQSL